MNTPTAASAAGASACDVLVIGGGPAGSTAAALPADGATSVGAVAWPYYPKTRNRKSLEQFLRDTIVLYAPLGRCLHGAQLETGAANG